MARGLRIGLTLAIAIATIACGSATPSASTGPAAGSSARGSIALPAGSSLDRSKLTVGSSYGSSAVGADGSFAVPARGTGPTFVDVTDAAGKIVLLGTVDPAKPQSSLSTATTATVLLFWALGAFTVPGDHFAEVVDLIATTPQTASLATELEGRLAANPTLITDGDAAALAAVLEARDAILAGTAALPLGALGPELDGVDTADRGPAPVANLVVARGQGGRPSVALAAGAGPSVIIDEAVPKSGIEILANPNGPGIVAQNSRRRDVALFVYQVGSEDANGVRTDLDKPMLVGTPHPVPATRALNVVVSTLDAFSSAGRSAWAPVLSDPIDLPLIAGSAKTFYTVVAIGPTADLATVPALYATTKWFDHVDAWKKAARDLGWRGFLAEHVVPMLSATIFGAVYAVPTLRITQFESALRTSAEGVLGARGIVDPVALSSRSKALFALVEEAGINASYSRELITEVTQTVGEAELNVERIAAVQARLRLLSKAGLILAIIDAVFSAADIGAVAKDLVESSQAETWNVTALEATVRLDPAAGAVSLEAPSVAFTATVKGEPNAIYLYRWSTSGQYGLVSDYLTDGLSVDSRSGEALYLANDPASITADLHDTVTVEVFANDGSGAIPAGASPIGKATATVSGLKAEPSGNPPAPGTGRLTVESLEFVDSSFNKKGWCVGYWIAIAFVPGSTDYFVHAEGFRDPDADPIQDFHFIWTQIGDYPTPPVTGCPTGIVLRDREILIFLGSISSFSGPINKADADKMQATFEGLKVTVRTE
jgi:hypothetical protein